MLVLSRKVGESFFIGDDVQVKVIDIVGGQVRIGISAPKTTNIVREELVAKMPDSEKPKMTTA